MIDFLGKDSRGDFLSFDQLINDSWLVFLGSPKIRALIKEFDWIHPLEVSRTRSSTENRCEPDDLRSWTCGGGGVRTEQMESQVWGSGRTDIEYRGSEKWNLVALDQAERLKADLDYAEQTQTLGQTKQAQGPRLQQLHPNNQFLLVFAVIFKNWNS